MKKVFISLLLIASLSVKAQLVPTIDTSFHPRLDTITSIAACKIQPIKASFSSVVASYLTIKVEDDNLQSMANLKCSFVTSDFKSVATYTLTIQGYNYTDWTVQGTEYLFKLFATYSKTNPDIGITIVFK